LRQALTYVLDTWNINLDLGPDSDDGEAVSGGVDVHGSQRRASAKVMLRVHDEAGQIVARGRSRLEDPSDKIFNHIFTMSALLEVYGWDR
jgi:hypothetical protein